MNYKLIPVLFALVFLLVPPMSSFGAVTDPVTYSEEVEVDTSGAFNRLIVDNESSDGFVYFLYNEEDNAQEVFFTRTADGEVNAKVSIISPETDHALIDRYASVYPYPDDSVIVVGFVEEDLIGGDYILKTIRSTDGGATWSAKYTIANLGSDFPDFIDDLFGGMIFKVSTDGDLYLIVNQFVDDGNNFSGEAQPVIYRSDDDAVSWTFQSVVSGFEYDSWYPYFVWMDDSGFEVIGDTLYLMMTGYDDDYGDEATYWQRSLDEGVTWLTGVDEEITPMSFEYDTEGFPAIWVEGNEILAVWSDTFYGHHYSKSTDNGATWSGEFGVNSFVLDTTSHCHPSFVNSKVLRLDDYVLLMCGGAQTTPVEDGVMYVESTDFGDTWGTPTEFIADVLNPFGFRDRHTQFLGDVTGNNMGFSWYYQQCSLFNCSTFGEEKIMTLYAQNPTSFNDFVWKNVTSGIQIHVNSANQVPNIDFVNQSVIVSWIDVVASHLKYVYATLANDGLGEPDAVPPVISGDEPITLIQNSSFDAFEHVTCIDDVDGAIVPNGNFWYVGEITIDTSNKGSQTQDYTCTDSADNNTLETIQYIIKKKSTGGGGSSSFTSSGSDTLENTPPLLSFSPSGSESVSEQGTTFSDLFANLFNNPVGIENPTAPSPTQSGESTSTPSQSNTANAIQNFFTNLFGGFFN